MEVESALVNDQKRKILASNGENVVKKAKLELNGHDEPVKPVVKSPIQEPEVVKVETDEPEVTLDEIRRLKEILRQEDAKLQLIKKIKATMIISDPKKPKIEAKVKSEVKGTGIRGTTPVVTVRIPKPNSDQGDTKSNRNNVARSNSPMTDQKASVQSTAASYEKNRQRKDLLKQQLNRTLKEITQAPPPPSTDVNFFPSATNNEFLVLLGLELCVNRIKRDENKDQCGDAYVCAECDRDFSPSWKFDSEGRRLCAKCYSQLQMKDLTKVQEGKFADFKSFWNEKEQELKEIDYQLQKDEEAIRAQRLEVERERNRREQERIKRERERVKEQADKLKSASHLTSMFDQQKLMQQLLAQQRKAASSSSSKAKSDSINPSNLARSLASTLTGSNIAQQIAEASRGTSNSVNETLLRQLTQLASGSNQGASGLGNASTLQSIHTQILKQELLRRQEKLRKEREEAERRTKAMEQLQRQQRQMEEARRQQQAQQQQTQAQDVMRQLLQYTQLMSNNQRSSGGGSSGSLSNSQLVNQQLANFLKNSDPATLRTLSNQLQMQQNSKGKN